MASDAHDAGEGVFADGLHFSRRQTVAVLRDCSCSTKHDTLLPNMAMIYNAAMLI